MSSFPLTSIFFKIVIAPPTSLPPKSTSLSSSNVSPIFFLRVAVRHHVASPSVPWPGGLRFLSHGATLRLLAGNLPGPGKGGDGKLPAPAGQADRWDGLKFFRAGFRKCKLFPWGLCMKNEGFFNGMSMDFCFLEKNVDFMGFPWIYGSDFFFSDLDGDSIRDLLLRCSKPGDFSRWV